MNLNEKKLQERIKWTPHKNQVDIIESDARDIVINAGRRFGKSATCAYIALRVLLEKDKKIWIVAPTYELSKRVFDYLVKWYMMAAPEERRNAWSAGISNRPIPQIRTPWGSLVQCKSAENPAGLLGEELDLLIIDECSRVKRNVYESYLYPTTTIRKAKTLFISTPFGKNWFYEKWISAKKAEDGAAFQYTSRDNPFVPPGEWERAKKMLPTMSFDQEYRAVFLSDAAAVFRGVHEIIDPGCLSNVKAGHQYVIGVDIAKHNDFTVITVMDKSVVPHPIVYIDRFNQIDWNLQKARIVNIAKRYNNARIVLDSTSVGSPISDDLKRAGVHIQDFTFTRKSKPELVEKLTISIEQRKIRIPDNEDLIDELGAYGYKMTESGNVTYSAPIGLHDDMVMSLALAVWPLKGRKTKPARAFGFTQTTY